MPDEDSLPTLVQLYAAYARPPRGALWSKELGYVKLTREESIERHGARRGTIGAVRRIWASKGR